MGDHYHVLLLDLCKSELQVDPFLKTLRQHGRYGKMPIIVLAAERELSDAVKVGCSFVVFQPLSAPMLREGLLWCLDRRALQLKDGAVSPDRKSQKIPKDDSSVPALSLSGSAGLTLVPTPLSQVASAA